MPHIHERYDFVVSAFIVRKGKVLLVYHKKYREWLPIGGHIELNEDPDQALVREIREECGLKTRFLHRVPPIRHRNVKPLMTPAYIDNHKISSTHRHIAFVYFAEASSDQVRLCEREHREFRWFGPRELAQKRWKIIRSIRFYCKKALEASRKGRSR